MLAGRDCITAIVPLVPNAAGAKLKLTPGQTTPLKLGSTRDYAYCETSAARHKTFFALMLGPDQVRELV